MEKILHIIASPRGSESRTLQISSVGIAALQKKFPLAVIDELNVFTTTLPRLTRARIDGKYTLLGGKNLSGETEKAWQDIIVEISRFLSADMYIISTPMWNFGVPAELKQYIDVILQPRYLFQYTATGPEGLAKNKKMLVISTRGGDYTVPERRNYDLLEPSLKTVFGLAGISDITFIAAQPMDAAGPTVRDQKIRAAQKQVEQYVDGLSYITTTYPGK